MIKTVYSELASLVTAYQNCLKNNNVEWLCHHDERINKLVKNYLPHGSGVDSGVELDKDKSNENKLIFNSSFHAMDENGYYNGWIDFQIKVTPSLSSDINVDVKGRFGKRQDLKDYLGDLFDNALRQEIPKV